MAISHCNVNFQEDPNTVDAFKQSYIWEIENPNAPLFTLEPPSSCLCLEYSQKDPTSLVAGLFSGQVAAWDTRSGTAPVAASDREVGHRNPVKSVMWINSKSGSEFFSGSSDGQVIWWDIRKLQVPLERLLMDPIRTDDQFLERSFGVSVLEYETTIPTRFMCGTEQGMLFSCNRKGKSPNEKINIRVRGEGGFWWTLSSIKFTSLSRSTAIWDRFTRWPGIRRLSRTFSLSATGRPRCGRRTAGRVPSSGQRTTRRC